MIEKTREFFRSVVPQRGLTQTFFNGDSRYNASWDYNVSPEGRHYFSVCAEGPIIDAMVYEYIPGTHEMIECFDSKKDIITYPRTVRPSKVHTCLSFMEDGRIIFNNHTTAQSPVHPTWMPVAYYGHPWEGFPGSNIMIYDPKTGKTEDRGIPVRGKSLYGGVYDPTHRSYYCTGYFRGHGYRYDLDTCQVTDYGQVTEFSSYFHYMGPDGNIYFSTVSGMLMRYNVEKQIAEETGIVFPTDPASPESQSHNVFAYACTGPDKRIYFCTHHSEHLYAYDCYKNELQVYGNPAPAWYREKYSGKYLLFGMDFDSKGTLWYGLKILGNCMRLVSIDILNGGEPQDYGIVGTPEHASWNFCQAHIVDDILYGATTNHAWDGPSMIEIDLGIMREDIDKPRERVLDKICYRGTPDVDLYPGEEKLTGEAAADATGGAREERKRIRGQAYSDGILRSRQSNNQNEFATRDHYVTRLWRELGTENSNVRRISHDADGNTVAISGNGPFFRTVIHEDKVISKEQIEYDPATEKAEADALAAKYKNVYLPTPAGRNWLGVATAEAPLADGSALVGTRGGGLCIVKADGTSFNLGFASTTGPVIALASSPDRRTVYGIAGDPEEIAFVFSYSMTAGVVAHGVLFFEGEPSERGTGMSSEPTCLEYAPDGKSIAFGVRDRLGCVYEYYFDDPALDPGDK